MDLKIRSSETKYEMKDNRNGQVTMLQCTKPVEVIFEGVDIEKYFITKSKLKTVHKTPRRKPSNKTATDQEKIDRILDKISASGYDSLTKEEKALLFNAGKK